MSSRRTIAALVAALAASGLAASGGTAASGGKTWCAPRSGYAYAGVQSDWKGHGISAVLTALEDSTIESGHVAGWVGVGAPGEGVGGKDEWLQVGLNRVPGSGNTLYYEVMRPGSGLRYAEIANDVPRGEHFRVAVLEMAATPGRWRVWVDGRPVTPAIALSSKTPLTPMAMGESWSGGRPTCNRFSYRFARVSIAAARGGSWQPARESTILEDPGYRVVRRAPASFDATASIAPATFGVQRSPAVVVTP